MYNPLMHGAVLIYGGNSNERTSEIGNCLQILDLNEDSTDVLKLTVPEGKKSIGIEQVREAIIFINKKPYSGDNKAIVIHNADKLTADGQNALLKLLEEPPAYAVILLSAKTENTLLPTVISRCQKISPQTKEGRVGDSVKKSGVRDIFEMTIGERLAWAEETAKDEKDTIIDKLEQMTAGERFKLPEEPSRAKSIKILLKVIKDLETTNVSTRLALEYLATNSGNS